MKRIYRINWLAATDGDAVTAWLRQMARRGWYLEKAGGALWRFLRGEPGEAVYAVAYFPGASIYGGPATEEQTDYIDLCAAAGWGYIGQWKRMQIFRAQRPDAVPLETEPEQKLETIQAAMRPFQRSSLLLALLALVQLGLYASLWRISPAAMLASPGILMTLTGLPALLLMCLTDLVLWRRWLRRSRRSIQRGGDCVKSAFPAVRQIYKAAAVLLVLLACQAGWYFLRTTGGWKGLAVVGGYLLLMALAALYTRALRKRDYPDKVIQQNLWFFVGVTCAIILIIGLTRPRLQRIEPNYYYEIGTNRYGIYTDTVPVTWGDLGIEAGRVPLSSLLTDDSASPLVRRVEFWLLGYLPGATDEVRCTAYHVPWRWLREQVVLPAAEREQTRWQTLYRWGEDIVLLSADRSLTEDQLAAIRAGLTRWFGGGGG